MTILLRILNCIKRWLVWLSRIHCCRGFGIQSPTDYAFVRYVVNEHWPYYAYEELTDKDPIRQKLGRLYFRLANWRLPGTIAATDYKDYWYAGCKNMLFVEVPSLYKNPFEPLKVDMALITIEEYPLFVQLKMKNCHQKSVVVIEGIWRNWPQWRVIERDPEVGTTFDLYYCGIVLFDTDRYKHHYKINF